MLSERRIELTPAMLYQPVFSRIWKEHPFGLTLPRYLNKDFNNAVRYKRKDIKITYFLRIRLLNLVKFQIHLPKLKQINTL